jgi:signal transduction histidine kinase
MEAIGHLAGGVAHEFNNIFAIILFSSELLEDEVGRDNKFFQKILRATARGAELTQQLLSFSCRQVLLPCALDLNTALDGMMRPLMQTLGDRTVLEVRGAPDLWPVTADPAQLETALINLASNARDAMPLGGELVIETTNVTLDESNSVAQPDLTQGDYVLLAVRDTGCGIASETLEHVFEPFFTTKDVGKGCGLGLSVVFGFAKQSGGHVTIESAPDCGTTVKLYLPRSHPSEIEETSGGCRE